jgi:hypothetical protein
MTLDQALDKSRPMTRPAHLAGTQTASAVDRSAGWHYTANRSAAGEVRIQRVPLRGNPAAPEYRLSPASLPPLRWHPHLMSALMREPEPDA